MTISRTLPFSAFVAAALLSFITLGTAQAQQVYRIVGPDGKISFSDRAPEKMLPGSRTSTESTTAASSGTNSLPYDLRQVVQRFPVTLYTGDNCAPCGSARTMLLQRGIPFTERTVNTNEDIDALQRLSGNSNLPFGTIGSQQLSGYSQTEWTQYIDLAGYPKKSSLPANYVSQKAAPLVAIKQAEATRNATQPRSPTQVPRSTVVPSGPTPSNPAGIQF